MTSVGYGQRFPKSPQGKGVAILAAIFGAFYMAMPLTIIGSTFYDIYIEQEENKKKTRLKLKLRSAAFSIAKKTSFFRKGNELPPFGRDSSANGAPEEVPAAQIQASGTGR